MSKTSKTKNVCDEIVYKKLFHELAENVFQFLNFKYKNEEIAHEGMQEAFIALWKNCKKVPLEKAKNYVFTAGRNKAVDILRKRNKHLSITDDDFLTQEEETFHTADDEKKQKMQKILSKMSSSSKEAFLMNRLQGLKYKEIAEDLNISVKAVEKRMGIALKTIRDELG